MKRIFTFLAAAITVVTMNAQTTIDITTTTVGATDYSTAFWGAHSQYFAIAADKVLTVEFDNFNNAAVNNWNNWVLVVTNDVDRGGNGYTEYFALRADAYGWGNTDYAANNITINYPDTDQNTDIWNDFRTTMDGAAVTISVEHTSAGMANITATAIGTNTTELVETYFQAVSGSENIRAFLTVDACYLNVNSASLADVGTTTNGATIEIEGEVVSTDYYSISGVYAGSDYNTLTSGVYIKKEVYNTGSISTAKIIK